MHTTRCTSKSKDKPLSLYKRKSRNLEFCICKVRKSGKPGLNNKQQFSQINFQTNRAMLEIIICIILFGAVKTLMDIG